MTVHQVFDSSSLTQIIKEHIWEPPTPPGYRTEMPLPPELDRIILSCLEKDPENRQQSALEFRRALESIAFAVEWNQERAREWWLQNGPRPSERPAESEGDWWAL